MENWIRCNHKERSMRFRIKSGCIVCEMRKIPLKISYIFCAGCIVVFVDMQGKICIFLTDFPTTKLHCMIASHSFSSCWLLFSYLESIRVTRNCLTVDKLREVIIVCIDKNNKLSTFKCSTIVILIIVLYWYLKKNCIVTNEKRSIQKVI